LCFPANWGNCGSFQETTLSNCTATKPALPVKLNPIPHTRREILRTKHYLLNAAILPCAFSTSPQPSRAAEAWQVRTTTGGLPAGQGYGPINFSRYSEILKISLAITGKVTCDAIYFPAQAHRWSFAGAACREITNLPRKYAGG